MYLRRKMKQLILVFIATILGKLLLSLDAGISSYLNFYIFLLVLCLLYKSLAVNIEDSNRELLPKSYIQEAVDSNAIGSTNYELKKAHQRIKELERKVDQLESRIPQKFTDVRFLNYQMRKRILVSFYRCFCKNQKAYHITNFVDNWWSWVCWLPFSGLSNETRT